MLTGTSRFSNRALLTLKKSNNTLSYHEKKDKKRNDFQLHIVT